MMKHPRTDSISKGTLVPDCTPVDLLTAVGLRFCTFPSSQRVIGLLS
jgi:hypothetical protein